MSRNGRNLLAVFTAFVAVSVGSLLLDALTRREGESVRAPAGDETAMAEPGTGVDPEFEAAQKELTTAKAELLRALGEGAVLDDEDLAPVKENLGFFESAVVEVLAALSDNPDDPTLRQTLLEVYRNQVALLEKAVRISGEE